MVREHFGQILRYPELHIRGAKTEFVDRLQNHILDEEGSNSSLSDIDQVTSVLLRPVSATSRPSSRRRAAYFQHRAGLADAGSGAEQHSEPRTLRGNQPFIVARATFNSSTLTLDWPRYPRSGAWI